MKFTKRNGYEYEHYLTTIKNPNLSKEGRKALKKVKKNLPKFLRLKLRGRDPNRKQFIPVLVTEMKKNKVGASWGGRRPTEGNYVDWAKNTLQSDCPLRLNPKYVAVYSYPKDVNYKRNQWTKGDEDRFQKLAKNFYKNNQNEKNEFQILANRRWNRNR